MNERRLEVTSTKTAQYINQVIVKDYLRFLSFNKLLFDGYNKKRQSKIYIEFRTIWAVYDTLGELENRYIQKKDRKKEKSFYKSHKYLSKLSGVNIRQVISCLNLLERYGIIKIIRDKDTYNRNKINEYILIDGCHIDFQFGFTYKKDTGEYTDITQFLIDSDNVSSHSDTVAPYGDTDARKINKELINKDSKEREREESPHTEQTLDLSELTSQPKTENEQLYSEYNQYKNRFKTLIKTYKPGIDKKQIEIICQTERSSIEEWKALKTRMKFDNNNRLLNFDDYARNYLNSTAECYVKPLSWTKFIKFYEKFNKVQVPFQDKLNHHDTQDENRISNEKFLERVNFKEEWTPETIELYKTMIANNEKDGIDVTELKAELEQILREQDEQSK